MINEDFLAENYFYSDPDLKTDTSYLSHTEKYEEAIRKVTIVLKKVGELRGQGQYDDELYQ